MENVLLQTNQITKKYRMLSAVDQVSLTIREGDIYGLIGKNGAGKTTLMRMMLGSCLKTSGEITYNNEILKHGKSIGSTIESPPFYPNCTALENLHRFAIVFGGGKQEIEQVLRTVNLWEDRNKRVGKYSLGMKQRLGIAIALLGEPRFLILDEPTNGLDPEGISEMRELITRLNREMGLTFFISSHILAELSKIATKFAIMNKGKLIEELSAEELHNACRKSLEIYADDLPRAAELLAEQVDANAICIQDDHLTITTDIERSAAFNKLLSENQIAVSRMELKTESLEQYFFRKVNG